MRLFTISFIFFFVLAPFAQAYSLVEPTDYDDKIEIDTAPEWYLGKLDGFPHSYSISVEEETELEWQLLFPEAGIDGNPPRALLVQVLDRGVAEVFRLNQPKEDWQLWRDQETKDSYYISSVEKKTLQPGLYILEVSSVANEAKYILKIGNGSVFADNGYFSSLSQLFALKKFNNSSYWSVVGTKYIYLPALLVLLIVLLLKRRKIFARFKKEAI